MKTIAIIGAGAAGLMTAATILENTENQEYHIHIFEKNKTPGNKVIISGGGRCNVTTSITDKKILASKYTRGWDFIRKAMGKFGPQKVYDWFESHGVPLKIQEDLRVFPVSDDGYDIVDVYDRIFAKYRNRVTLHYNEGVDSLTNEGMTNYELKTNKGSYIADVVVVTTGGSAYSHTGSTGDGYAFARELGHTITPLGPSLSSFLTREKWTHELSGLAFPEARIGELSGAILLTHFGISGPLSFMYSSEIAWESLGSNSPKIIHLAPVADMDEKMWNTFLIEQFSLHPKKTITTVLSEKLPRRFVEGFVKEYCSHITDTYLSSVSKADRLSISELLGVGISITLIERRPGDEFVTAGGVNTDEIDPESMESKIQKNLYFAGEVLNVDGYTGGFSLQICWASGYVAGLSITRDSN